MRDRAPPVYWAAVAALLAAVFLVDLPPLVDYPQHLAALGVAARLGQPGSEGYEVQWFTPYALPFALGRGLTALLPLEAAGRVWVAAALALCALGHVRLQRAAGADPRFVLLALPFLVGYDLAYGFVAGLYGLGLALLVLAELVAALPLEPTPARLAALGTLGVLLFFTHGLAWGFLVGGGLAALAAATTAPPRRRLALAATLLSGGLPCALWFLQLRLAPREAAASALDGLGAPLGQRLLALPETLVAGLATGVGPLLAGAALGVALAWSWPLLRRGGAHRPLVAAAATWLLAYLLLPGWLGGIQRVRQRPVPLAAAALLACLPSRGAPSAGRWAAAAAAVALATPAALGYTWALVGGEAPGFRDALAAVPPGSRVLGLVVEPWSRVTGYPVFVHWPAYAVARGGGRVGDSFASVTHQPLRFRAPETPCHASYYPLQLFDPHTMTDRFDCFLARLPAGWEPEDPVALFFAPCPGRVRVLARAGQWWTLGRVDGR